MTRLPSHLRGALLRYVDFRVRPGGFLTAVLQNDLTGAVQLADSQSRQALPAIVEWLQGNAPSAAWGSKGAVAAWLDAGPAAGATLPAPVLRVV